MKFEIFNYQNLIACRLHIVKGSQHLYIMSKNYVVPERWEHSESSELFCFVKDNNENKM